MKYFRNITAYALLISLFIFALPVSTKAAINPMINYQGRLTDNTGTAVANADYNMRFKLYTTASGGSPIFTETLTGNNRIGVISGLFSVMVGSSTPITGVNFDQTLYLSVEIGGTDPVTPVWDGEMSPRKIIGTVPTAFVAENLDGGNATTSNLLVTSSTTLQNLTATNSTTTSATSTNFSATNFILSGASTGCAQFSNGGVLSSTGIACGSGSGGSAFPFTKLVSGEQATSTTLALLNGFISTASSTLQNFNFGHATGTDLFTSNGSQSAPSHSFSSHPNSGLYYGTDGTSINSDSGIVSVEGLASASTPNIIELYVTPVSLSGADGTIQFNGGQAGGAQNFRIVNVGSGAQAGSFTFRSPDQANRLTICSTIATGNCPEGEGSVILENTSSAAPFVIRQSGGTAGTNETSIYQTTNALVVAPQNTNGTLDFTAPRFTTSAVRGYTNDAAPYSGTGMWQLNAAEDSVGYTELQSDNDTGFRLRVFSHDQGSSYGNLVVNSSGFDLAGNNVGIGTSTPATLLQVGSDATTTAGGGNRAWGVLHIGNNQLANGSANGTFLGVNTLPNFTGNFADFQVNGTDEISLGATGSMTIQGAMHVGQSSIINWAGRSQLQSPSDGVIQMNNLNQNNFTRLSFGPSTASFAGIATISGSLSALDIVKGDGTAGASLYVGTSTSGLSGSYLLGNLVSASSTSAQLSLLYGAGVNGWTFRNDGGILEIATSSPTSFATSTTNALSIDANGAVSIPSTVTVGLLTDSNLSGFGTRCLQTNNNGVVSVAASGCGAGSGGGIGTWATTTSQVTGEFTNYPLNTTDIVVIGDSSTTTAPIYLDTNISRIKLFSQFFDAASTTLQNFTATNGTTTNATSTNFAATTICFTGDTCRTTWPTSSGSFDWPWTKLATGEQATSTTIEFNNGFISTASSTLSSFTFTTATGTSATTTSFSTGGLAVTGLVNTLLSVNSVGTVVATSTIGNNQLQQSTISGISLGNTLAALTAGSTLTSSGTYTGNTARTFDIDLTHPNNWSGLQTFSNASSTLFSSTIASTSQLILSGASNGCLQVSGGNVSSVGANCLTSMTFAWPWTKQASGSQATSTVIEFTAGALSDASTTIGGGTTASGLTISGGATTTGDSLHLGSTTLQKFTFTSATGTNQVLTDSTTSDKIVLSYGDGVPGWALNDVGGDLNLSSTTPSTGATTSTSVLTVKNNGLITLHPDFNGLTVNNTGQVGINTASPLTASILTVGVDAASGNSTNGVLMLGTHSLSSPSANGTYFGINAVSGFSGNYIHFQKNNSNEFILDNTGSITELGGAVASLNSTQLEVYQPSATVTVGNSGDTGTGSNLILQAGAGGSGANLDFQTDNITRARLSVMGFGIGTTTPRYVLQIASSTGPQLALTDGGGNFQHWTFRNEAGYLYIGTSSPSTFATSTVPLLILTTQTNKMGAVGIGTTTPSQTFAVSGNGEFSAPSGGNGVANVVIDDVGDSGDLGNVVFSGNGTLRSQITGRKDATYGSVISFNLRNAGANNTNQLMTLSGYPGAVGIGTTSPEYMLQIASSSAPQLALTDGTAGVVHWTFRNSGGMLYLATSSVSTFATSSATALTIDGNSGNVGIGTTTPGASLDVIGAVCVDDSTPTCANAARAQGTIYSVSALSQTLDLAESYPTKDRTIQPGEIVMLDKNNPQYISRALPNSDMPLLGIVSTKPGFWLGGFNDEMFKEDKKLPVALSGHVPTKVNSEGGEIHVGDRITISSTPGVGKKATSTDYTVGIALENMTGSSGTIEVFANLANPLKSKDVVALEQRVSALELNLANPAFSISTTTNESLVSSVLNAIGATVQDAVLYIKSLVVGKLTVGTAVEPTGITLYDTVTHNPYCLSITNGTPTSVMGVCGGAQNSQSGGSGGDTTPPPTTGGDTTSPDSTSTDVTTTDATSTPPTDNQPPAGDSTSTPDITQTTTDTSSDQSTVTTSTTDTSSTDSAPTSDQTTSQ